jgi:TolB-like protein/Flp pilus assembly protein TadD
MSEPLSPPNAAPIAPVFISYSSADAALANRLCDAVEASGIPCWIAPRDVRAGEVYADAIVQAINACRAMVVLLSKTSLESSHVLREIERASSKKRSIIALRVGSFSLPPAFEYFLSASHWLDASDGRTDKAITQLIADLHGSARMPGAAAVDSPGADSPGAAAPVASRESERATTRGPARLGLSIVVALMLIYLVVDKLWLSKPSATPPLAGSVSVTGPASKAATASASFSPAPHSVAVLPFVNLSGDPKDDYFSDGLSVELLDSLASIPNLQVAARTSSFSFKGKDVDVTEIARRLNVGAILEGSIRKDGKHVRITANLVNAKTGFRLWSNTYDRDLRDILKLQTEIATAVTTALQATLLGDAASLVELGGTQNPQAFDAYLRGERLVGTSLDAVATQKQFDAYDEAISLDPGFAKAYVAKALAEVIFASNTAATAAAREGFQRARNAAEKAVAIAPALGEAHSALGFVLDAGFQDYAGAASEHERALALAPGNSRVLLMSARFLSEIGRSDAAVSNAQRAVVLDPLNPNAYRILGLILLYTRHFHDAVVAYDRALRLNPQAVQAAASRGLAQFALGDYAAAQQSCSIPPLDWYSHLCLAIVWHKLNRETEANAELAALRASAADENDQAYQYAEVYAQWGSPAQALDWLETAYRVRDPGLLQLKVDYLLDPIRREPRFQTILEKMRFPD